MAERFRTQTDRHKIAVDFPPGFPVVLADESRLEQVFSNLIGSAMKQIPRLLTRHGPNIVDDDDYRLHIRKIAVATGVWTLDIEQWAAGHGWQTLQLTVTDDEIERIRQQLAD